MLLFPVFVFKTAMLRGNNGCYSLMTNWMQHLKATKRPGCEADSLSSRHACRGTCLFMHSSTAQILIPMRILSTAIWSQASRGNQRPLLTFPPEMHLPLNLPHFLTTWAPHIPTLLRDNSYTFIHHTNNQYQQRKAPHKKQSNQTPSEQEKSSHKFRLFIVTS